jgi:hypothetical protein
MRVLLVGEYSNVHWTLAKGLREEGVDAVVASEGDFWKAFPRDVDLAHRTLYDRVYTSANYRLFNNRLLSENSRKLLSHLRTNRYDVIQFINPRFLIDSAGHLLTVFRKIRQMSSRLYLGAYGDDYFYIRACLDGKLRYSILDPWRRNPELPQFRFSFDCLSPDVEALNREMADHVNGIVAPVVEYHIPYREAYSQKLSFIPFPVDTASLPFQPNRYNGKAVRFFHGVQKNREIIKGTEFILRTMEAASQLFGEKMVFETAADIPFDEYPAHLQKFNVIVDQVYGFSQGMNALQAMALGRVVMAGCEPEFLESMNLASAPVFNITADVNANLEQVKAIINSADKLEEMGEESRRFVETHHDYRKVARKYLSLWSKKP